MAFAFPDLGTVTGYTFTWSVSGGGFTVFAGCGTTDYLCNIGVGNVAAYAPGVGTYSGNGQSGYGSANAVITRMSVGGGGGGPIP